MRKRQNVFFILLLLIVFGGFLVRLYRFDNPIADWHSWRQADTSAVSRNFIKHGFDLLHPQFDDLSNIPSGKDNPYGYRFVEFPLYNFFQAGLYRLLPFFTLEEWGRLVTIIVSLCSSVFLYLIVKKHSNQATGLLTAFFFTFFPYNIYYDRTILPDPSMVMTILGGTYFFDRWIEKIGEREKRKGRSFVDIYLILSLVFTAAAFLLKPYALFFTLPIVYLAFEQFRWSIFKQWKLYIFLLLSVAPLVGWRIWMTQYPEGIPASSWLFNGNGIRFRPAFFRWLGYERLTKLISGYFGIIFFFLGIVQARKSKDTWFFYSFLLSAALYCSVIATGNVQHDYYQILVMPTIAIFYGIGAYALWTVTRQKNQLYFVRVLVILLTAVTFWISWGYIKDYFNINNPSIIEAGKAVDHLTPPDAKVIAPYDGDTAFLYQTNRQGWPAFETDLPVMIQKLGADYLVLVHPTPGDIALKNTYKLLAHSSDFVLYDLHTRP